MSKVFNTFDKNDYIYLLLKFKNQIISNKNKI